MHKLAEIKLSLTDRHGTDLKDARGETFDLPLHSRCVFRHLLRDEAEMGELVANARLVQPVTRCGARLLVL